MIATTTTHPGHPDYLFHGKEMNMLTSPGSQAYTK